MAVYIYGLVCPVSDEVRYIGKSEEPKKRLVAHIGGALRSEYNHHTARWIRKVARLGLQLKLVILDEVPESADWREREREWIAAGLEVGWPLTNSTAGGEGLDYLDPADRAKWLKNQAASMRKHWDSDAGREHIRKLTASLTEPVVRKRTESVRSALQRPEYREKMRAVGAEIGARPEVRAKKSGAMRAQWDNAESRAKWESSFSTEQCKARQSDARIKAWADPVVGAKLRGIHSSDAVRKKKAEAKAKNWADPAYRAMMSERIKAGWAKRRLSKGA